MQRIAHPWNVSRRYLSSASRSGTLEAKRPIHPAPHHHANRPSPSQTTHFQLKDWLESSLAKLSYILEIHAER